MASQGEYTVQEGDVEGDKVPVSTPQGRTIEVMIPDQSKPGDVLAVLPVCLVIGQPFLFRAKLFVM